MSLSDLSHLDPCRKCRGIFPRVSLIRANKVRINGHPKSPGSKGYFCGPCVYRMAGGKILN